MAYKNLLSTPAARIVFFVGVALLVGGYGREILSHDGRMHPSGLGTLGRDFINYWSGAKLTLAGQTDILFGPTAIYYEWLKDEFGQGLSFHNWGYPPSSLLFLWPLGFLPYIPAFMAWVLFGLTALYKALLALVENKTDALVLLCAPASFINIYTGQNGFLTASLLLGAFAILDRRPILAGVLIGILTVKPQLGFLIPIALLLMWKWKTIFSAAFTAIFLVAISALLFGIDKWTFYFSQIIPLQEVILKQASEPFNHMVPSAYMAVKNAGLSEGLAVIMQVISSAIALSAVIWGFMKKRDKNLQIALLCICTLMFTPYVVYYDMAILAPAAYLYFRHIQAHEFAHKTLHYAFALFTAILPMTGNMCAQAGIQIYPFAMLAFLLVLVFVMRQNSSELYKEDFKSLELV